MLHIAFLILKAQLLTYSWENNISLKHDLSLVHISCYFIMKSLSEQGQRSTAFSTTACMAPSKIIARRKLCVILFWILRITNMLYLNFNFIPSIHEGWHKSWTLTYLEITKLLSATAIFNKYLLHKVLSSIHKNYRVML